VFFMAFNKYNKLVKLLIRALTRLKLLKKYSHLILIPSIPVAKKVRLKVAP
jgi:hypothetical protein